MSIDDFRECPFCGSYDLLTVNGSTTFHIKCKSCGTFINYKSEAEALAKWNMRATREKKREAV